MRRISAYVDLDLRDVFDEISDAELTEEVARRCIEVARTPERSE